MTGSNWPLLREMAGFSLVSLSSVFFGITLPAFKIAGGLLLFLISLEMMRAHRSRT